LFTSNEERTGREERKGTRLRNGRYVLGMCRCCEKDLEKKPQEMVDEVGGGGTEDDAMGGNDLDKDGKARETGNAMRIRFMRGG